MLVSEIIANSKVDIGQEGDAGRFSDQDLLDLTNEAYVDFCRFTEAREKLTTVAVATNQSLFSLPSNFLEGRQTRWSNNKLLYPKSQRRLDYDSRNWVYESETNPVFVVYWNWDQMRLHPIPSSAGTVTLRHAYIPDTLTTADEPDFPRVWHSALEDYVSAECFYAMREYKSGNTYWIQYLNKRSKAKMQFTVGQRTPDTLGSMRPKNNFNYQHWDQRFSR